MKRSMQADIGARVVTHLEYPSRRLALRTSARSHTAPWGERVTTTFPFQTIPSVITAQTNSNQVTHHKYSCDLEMITMNIAFLEWNVKVKQQKKAKQIETFMLLSGGTLPQCRTESLQLVTTRSSLKLPVKPNAWRKKRALPLNPMNSRCPQDGKALLGL